MEVFYPFSNLYKIDATLRETRRPNSISFLSFLTPNVIQEENKHEMYVQKIYF